VQRDKATAYRLLMLSMPKDAALMEPLSVRSTFSLKSLSAGEVAAVRALQLGTEPANGRDVAELAAAFPYGARNEAWFRVFNDLPAAGEPSAEQPLKVLKG
ncbi:MAG: putative Zn-dependent protease, partial [Gammaproteobacteria bacterium]